MFLQFGCLIMLKRLIQTSFLIIFIFSPILSFAYDDFDGEILKMKSVRYGSAIYTNVSITVSKVISIGSGFAFDDTAIYNSSINTLYIPQVNYKNTLYDNVILEVGKVFSVGTVMYDKTYDDISISGANDLVFSPVPGYNSKTGANLQFTWASKSYWKVEYDGAEKGSCEVLAQESNNIMSGGLCINSLRKFDDFFLWGRIGIGDGNESNAPITLSSLNNGPIFKGFLNTNGIGGGTWEHPRTNSKGTWIARKFSDLDSSVVPNSFKNASLLNPMTGSIAAEKLIWGTWWGVNSRDDGASFTDHAMFLPNGKFAILNQNTMGSPYLPCCVTLGDINLINDQWQLGSQSVLYGRPKWDYISSKVIPNNYKISGSGYFIPNDRIVGTMKVNGYSPNLNTDFTSSITYTVYSPQNALAITLKDLKGIYYSKEIDFGYLTTTIIQEDGTFSGSIADGIYGINGSAFAGCKFIGSLKPIDPTKKYNLFEMKVKYYSKYKSASCVNGDEFAGYITLAIDQDSVYLRSIIMRKNSVNRDYFQDYTTPRFYGKKIQ